MEALKELLDSLRSSVYTILSLLLPGSIIVYLAQSLLPERFRLPPRVAGFLVAAYVAGLAAQGFGGVVPSLVKRIMKAIRKYRKKDGQDAKPKSADDETEAFVKGIIDKNLGTSIPASTTFNVTLSSVHDHREVYDRFTALRDMCRGLIVASVIALIVLLVRRKEFSSGVFWGAIAVLVAAAAGLNERYIRFSPLPRQIVFGQFIAAQLKKPKADEAK